MTAEHERAERDSATGRLLAAYRLEGDTRARDRLVELYLPLVETLARRHRGSRAEHDDLVQAGSIGLLNAIERYDPSRSDEFAAYAVPTVSGEMKRFIRDRTATVRLPRGLQEARARLPSARERLTRSLGREPTEAELAEALDISPVDLPGLTEATKEAPTASETAAGGRPEPDVADERLALAGAFSALDEQEREIVYLRYVEELDRKEVAHRLGMSEGRLGRLTRAALSKLRTELEDDGLRRVAEASQERPTATATASGPAEAPDRKTGGHSGRLLLRMPRPLHDDLAEAAEREGVSLNRFITATLTAAIDRRATGPTGPQEPARDGELEAREVPRWLPAAIIANIVVVALAAVVALVLLAIAWQNGW